MANKRTKRDNFNDLLNLDAVKTNAELRAFVEHELDLLAKKNTSEKKPTATQKENENVKVAILEGMQKLGRPITITELMTVPTLAGFTNQKLSHLTNQLVTDGMCKKAIDKRKAFFEIA